MKRRHALCLLALAWTPTRGRTEEGGMPPGWPDADLLLLGEQHDAPEHQQHSARVVTELAAQGRLAALALEMAEQGHDTTALPRDASDTRVRAALAWDEAGWPWATYGPIVCAARRAGVPVHGANLRRADMRDAMRDATLDTAVPETVRQRLQADVRDGHCGLLPESQWPGMTRVQIARDRTMAATLRGLAQPGRVVLLVAGAHHVDATCGVPLHLAGSGLRLRTVRLAAGATDPTASPGFDETWPTPARPAVDHCAQLARRLAHPPR